jgi:hypothetical protein
VYVRGSFYPENGNLSRKNTPEATFLFRRGLFGIFPLAADHIAGLACFLASRFSQSLTKVNLALLVIHTITIMLRMAGGGSTDNAVSVKCLRV